MTRLTASILAMGLAAAVGTASAQSGYYPQGQYPQGQYQYGTQPTVDRYGQSQGAQYDYARVIRVDPVTQSGYYGTSNNGQQNCRSNSTYAGNDPYYGRDDYYGRDRYSSGNDGYYGNDPYSQQRDGYGTTTGRTVATVLGTVLGAAIGSKVGGGSARYATSAVGSMVGGMAGRQVYETTQRNRQPARVGTVQVCDPVQVGDNRYGGGYSNAGYGQGSGVRAYDVTYEYGGRRYTSRTNYHPGDRIRVRVDVRPE